MTPELLTDKKILDLMTRIAASLPESPTSAAANALDILFKGLALACATGIGWMTISLPVMKDNLDDLKTTVAKIEEKTEDRFTRSDFLRERESLSSAIGQNTQTLKDRTEFYTTAKSDLRTLKQHHDSTD